MYYLAFNKAWFEKHQNKLLWLLKFRLFRKILRIECNDRIVEITPNSYTTHVSGVTFKTDFRTHDKYSKRLYYAFSPLWWAMHIWDIFADKAIPKLSFGFDTLTAYPDPDPETTTVDGQVQRVGNEAFGTIRSGVGTSASPSGASTFLQLTAGTTASNYILLRRWIGLFDTSTLTASATISAAALSLEGFGKANTYSTEPDLDIVSSNPASNTNLVSGDYNTLGTTPYASISYASFSTTGYNDFTLDASGIATISKTGVSKFGATFSWDTDNSAPTWGNSKDIELDIRNADTAATTSDPKLVVTYTLGGVRLLSLLGVGT